jgi:hypothetical protein
MKIELGFILAQRDFIKLNRLSETPSIFRAEDRGRFQFSG